MELKEWLKRNFINAGDVATLWGIRGSQLSLYMNGKLRPPIQVVCKALILSDGQVAFADWVMTCEAALIAEEYLTQEEIDIVIKKADRYVVVGNKPGRRKARKAPQKQDAGAEDGAQLNPDG